MLIGEDLGTVPAGFRERLSAAGIYGMSVLWFERRGRPFAARGRGRPNVAAMTSTHDLPTVAGWWRGHDIDVREQCGHSRLVNASAPRATEDRLALWRAFRAAKIATGEAPPPPQSPQVVDAAVKFIASTPSHLALLPLEDALALEEQPNLPGTIDQHPNWRRRYDGEAAELLDRPEVRRTTEAAGGTGKPMTSPRATMRLQLHRGFTFDDAAALVPYFAALGISHLYLSPILTARPGSPHGYDVVDPTRVNPELGGEEALRRLVREAAAAWTWHHRRHRPEPHGDRQRQNPWWMDVLAHGQESRYAKYFDIDWTPDNPASAWQGRSADSRPALRRSARRRRNNSARARMDRLRPLFRSRSTARGESTVADAQALAMTSIRLTEAGRERLHELLERQHYRLMWWRSANDEINWRRFFDINELAAIRVEDDDVFEAVHATIFRLYAEGVIDGLRIDHVDGLSRPGSIAESCVSGLARWSASGRRIAPKDRLISSWRKF